MLALNSEMITAQASNSAYEVSEQGKTAMFYFQAGRNWLLYKNKPPPKSQWLKKHYISCLHNTYYGSDEFSRAVVYPEVAQILVCIDFIEAPLQYMLSQEGWKV